jgi:hypothetical protein
LPDAQGVSCHHDGYDEDEPEDQLAENAGRRLAGVRPIEESLYAGALHPTVETYPLQDAADHGLEYLGHDVADDQYDDRADKLRQVRQERAQRVL